MGNEYPILIPPKKKKCFDVIFITLLCLQKHLILITVMRLDVYVLKVYNCDYSQSQC